MTTERQGPAPSRRNLLAWGGAAGAAVLVGCSSDPMAPPTSTLSAGAGVTTVTGARVFDGERVLDD